MKHQKWTKSLTISVIAFLLISPVFGSKTIQIFGAQVEDKSLSQNATDTGNDIWAGYPLLKRICAVESSGDPNGTPRQFDDDGVTPLWGREKAPISGKTVVVKRDVGECQINTLIWKPVYEQMGLDVVNASSDNVVFAKYLFDTRGTKDWTASRNGANGWGRS